MKKQFLIALITIASAAAMAQSPASTSAETNPTKSGGVAAEKAQARTDARKDGTAPATMGMGMGMGMNGKSSRWAAMDKNGDGMVSAAEYNAYHAGAWKKMKHTRGMVSMADMEAAMAGGPN